MNDFTYAALAAMMIFAGTTSYAQAAGCDDQSGAAFGLCNAYCKAMDCEGDFPQASDEACVAVFDNFLKITGSDMPPCIGSGLPQAGDACTTPHASIYFNPSDGELYGCDDSITWNILWCDDSQLVCTNSGG